MGKKRKLTGITSSDRKKKKRDRKHEDDKKRKREKRNKMPRLVFVDDYDKYDDYDDEDDEDECDKDDAEDDEDDDDDDDDSTSEEDVDDDGSPVSGTAATSPAAAEGENVDGTAPLKTDKEKEKGRLFAEKKKRQKTLMYYTIKTGVNRFCRDANLVFWINECAIRVSKIIAIASLLINFHVIRLLEYNDNCIREGREDLMRPMSVMDNTFFNRCVSFIANFGDRLEMSSLESISRKDVDLYNSMVQYRQQLITSGFQGVGRLPPMAQMLVIAAQQMRQNFAVSTEVNMKNRLKSWLHMKIEERATNFNIPYYTPVVVRSVLSILHTVCTNNSVESFAERMALYRVFKEHPLPPRELQWLELICQMVRDSIGLPIPVEIQRSPERFLPLMHAMQKDSEIYYQQPYTLSQSKKKKLTKLFSLVPEKRFRAMYITINTTILISFYNFLYRQLLDDDMNAFIMSDIWYYFFHIERMMKGRKEGKSFENQISTDGLFVSVLMARVKSVNADEDDVSSLPLKERIELHNRQRTAESKAKYAVCDGVMVCDSGRFPVLEYCVFVPPKENRFNQPLPSLSSNPQELPILRNRQITAKAWYYWSGASNTIRNAKKMMGKSEFILNFNASIRSCRHSCLFDIIDHINKVLPSAVEVVDYYSANRWKRLRMNSYIGKQKGYRWVAKQLKGEFQNPMVVYGDGKFSPSGVGNLTVPTSRMRREVGFNLPTVGMDEYNTSQKCSCCHSNLGSMFDEKTGFRSWKIRVCKNALCVRKFHDRNISACINMLYCFLSQVTDHGRPVDFQRPISAFNVGGNVQVVVDEEDESEDDED